jgi:hypothetical protein
VGRDLNSIFTFDNRKPTVNVKLVDQETPHAQYLEIWRQSLQNIKIKASKTFASREED